MIQQTVNFFDGAFRYLYRGAIDGFLVTGGFFFYAPFLMGWPITLTFSLVFLATTTVTTLMGIYLYRRDTIRDQHLANMNDITSKIRVLYDEIQYYNDKLAQESTLLKTPETSLNPHKIISQDDLNRIKAKVDELKPLERHLSDVRQQAKDFINQPHQRHIIGLYKSLVTGYVFYFSFPLFIMLAINAIIMPSWLAAFVVPVLIFSAASGIFGFFKSYIQEAKTVAKFDAAIIESEWIEESAQAVVSESMGYLNDVSINNKRETFAKELLNQGDVNTFRKDGSTRPAGYFLVKHTHESVAALDGQADSKPQPELSRKIPRLVALAKSLGERLPQPLFNITKENTWGKYIGWTLDTLAKFFYQYSLMNTWIDTSGRLFNAGVMGALVPGGVALFLKFVVGVAFTPLIVNIFIATIISTTTLSVLFRVFNDFRDRQRIALETTSDEVSRLLIEVKDDLKALHVERASLYFPEKDKESPPYRSVFNEGRQLILQRKAHLFEARNRLHKLTKPEGLLTSTIKWIGIVYNSLTMGYAWYMGFPLFVFLTVSTFIPITAPLAIYATLGFSGAAGLFGVARTLLAESQNAGTLANMKTEALCQCNAVDELLPHFDKPLYNKQLSEAHYRLKNQEVINHSIANIGQVRIDIPTDREKGQFTLLQALSRATPKSPAPVAAVNYDDNVPINRNVRFTLSSA